jgi:diguanylate cyclase (GGDEF)-like protein/PAS domain S-box-containing protein
MDALAVTAFDTFPTSPVLDHLADGILVTDVDLDQEGGPRVVYVNQALCEITGYDRNELIGASPGILQGPATDPVVLRRLRDDLTAGRSFAGQTINYRKDGTPFMMEWSIAVIPGEDGSPRWFAAVQRDATLPAHRLLAAEHKARIDELTGLPNRRHCDEILASGAWLSSRARSALIIDVDGFKSINDTHGHLVGDEVLRAIGGRLRTAVRDGDLVARWGGEEFCVLALDGSPGAGGLPDRLLQTIGEVAYPTAAGPLRVTASIGCAALRDDLSGAQALLDAADAAMYEAKRAGGNRFVTA